MASCVLSESLAQAELVQIKSKVIEVNAGSNYLKVDRLNSSGEMEEIKIDIERSAHFEIYTSIQDVKVGDDVAIEADFNSFNHEWKALSIAPYNENSANKVLQASVQEVQKNPETVALIKV